MTRMGWLTLALPILGTAGVAVLCWMPERPASVSLTSKTIPCTASSLFQIGYTDEVNSVALTGPRSVIFEGLSWVYLAVCRPGYVTFEGDGKSALNHAPELSVGLDGETLDIIPFKNRTSARVFVPRRGLLTLGFFNDYFRADIRIASFDQLQFHGPTCQGWNSVSVPPQSGGRWWPELTKATLVYSVPMTLDPCGPGTVSFLLSGRQGGGAFPSLRISQSGKTLLTLDSSMSPIPVSLRVSAAPLSITLTNPYGRALADRRIILQKITVENAEGQ